MSIRIPGGGAPALFRERPVLEPEPETGYGNDPAVAALELAHKADKALARGFLEQRGATGKADAARRSPAEDARAVLAEAPDEATRREAERHVSASVVSFALEREADKAREREARREDILRRRQADAAGHISRLTAILAGRPGRELRETAAEAVLAQLQSLDDARRAVGRGGDRSASTQRRTA